MTKSRSTLKTLSKPMSKKAYDSEQTKHIKKLEKDTKQLKKLVKGGDHYANFTLGATAFNTTGNVSCLSNVGQGPGTNGRQNTDTHIQNVQVRISFEPNATAIYQRVRFILFRWKSDASGTPPTVTSVLSSANVLAPLNKDNRNQFVVYKDILMPVDQIKGSSVRKMWQKVNHRAGYDGNGAANYTDNHLYYLIIGTQASGVNDATYAMEAQVQFSDL